jgi:hypothetical protein
MNLKNTVVMLCDNPRLMDLGAKAIELFGKGTAKDSGDRSAVLEIRCP